MNYRTLLYRKEGAVCHITLNRPRQGNAIDPAMSAELEDACARIAQDDGITVVTIGGAGGKFCTGSRSSERQAGCAAVQAVAGLDSVVIAAIDGEATAEGFELALACDIRLASERASFRLPQVADGALPLAGGTQRLPRLVGPGKALELLLAARGIDADEALDIGLVSMVVPVADLPAAGEELAGRLSACGPVALRFAKEAVSKGLDLTLEQGLRLEADLYFLIQTTGDRMEGISAFLQKRPPQFSGQ